MAMTPNQRDRTVSTAMPSMPLKSNKLSKPEAQPPLTRLAVSTTYTLCHQHQPTPLVQDLPSYTAHNHHKGNANPNPHPNLNPSRNLNPYQSPNPQDLPPYDETGLAIRTRSIEHNTNEKHTSLTKTNKTKLTKPKNEIITCKLAILKRKAPCWQTTRTSQGVSIPVSPS